MLALETPGPVISCIAFNAKRYYPGFVIRSFRDKETENVFRRELGRKHQDIARIAKRKLDQLHAAAALADLGVIPGNRLEFLLGTRRGQCSIRVND